MGNVATDRQPHISFLRFPGSHSTQVAGGAGDNSEVTSEIVNVLGNSSSAQAHFVPRARIEALEAEFFILLTLAASQTLQLKGIKWETMPQDASGDPDVGSAVALPDEVINYTIRRLAASPQHVEAQAAAGADITVATGALTAELLIVRFSRIMGAPLVKDFVRLKFTPDLSAGATDTSDIAQSFGGFSSHMPAEAAVDI